MSKKQRIKELEQRVAELERELEQYRKRENITYSEPTQTITFVSKHNDWRVTPRWYVESFEVSSAR